MGAPKAPRWTRKPPTTEGRYWAAVRGVGIFTGPEYSVLLCEVFGASLRDGLHVSGIIGGAMPMKWIRRQDIWWWPEPIVAPPPPRARVLGSR